MATIDWNEIQNRAADRLYPIDPFPSDLEPVELLVTEYQRLTNNE